VENNPHNLLKNRYKNTFLAKTIRDDEITAPTEGSYTSTQPTAPHKLQLHQRIVFSHYIMRLKTFLR
jgi:hypothetical protein